MENTTEDEIYKMVGLDKIKRSAMARYYGRITEDERVEAFKLAIDLAKRHMERAHESVRGKPIFFYAMLCLSAWKLSWTREMLAKKNPNLTSEQAKEISARRILSVVSARKDRIKHGRLKVLVEIRLYYIVKELRNKGISWRESSAYLQKYHHVRISHVHLHKLYKQIKEEKILRGEE